MISISEINLIKLLKRVYECGNKQDDLMAVIVTLLSQLSQNNNSVKTETVYSASTDFTKFPPIEDLSDMDKELLKNIEKDNKSIKKSSDSEKFLKSQYEIRNKEYSTDCDHLLDESDNDLKEEDLAKIFALEKESEKTKQKIIDNFYKKIEQKRNQTSLNLKSPLSYIRKKDFSMEEIEGDPVLNKKFKDAYLVKPINSELNKATTSKIPIYFKIGQ